MCNGIAGGQERKYFVINAVFLIRIGSDSNRFVGSGSGLVDWHPEHSDPDRYQFQENGKVSKLNFFSENVIMLSKILKIMTHLLDTDEKDRTL